MSADCPSVNGAGGNTSSAEAPPASASRAIRRLQAAVGPDAVNDRQSVTCFLSSDFHDAPLFFAGARGDLGRVRVDRDRRKPLHRRDVAQMRPETGLVDREILVERQQHRRYHTLRHEIGMAAHLSSPSGLFLLEMAVEILAHWGTRREV
jgi:hypothetical protein